MQEAVEQQAEQTAPIESAPIENKDASVSQVSENTNESQTDASISEKKTSETVPYERFREVNEAKRQLEERLAQISQLQEQPQAPEQNAPELDPTVLPALDQWYQAKRERERVTEFVSKHKEELKDPILAGTVERIIKQHNAQGKAIDQEIALSEAKRMLDERVKSVTQEVQQSSLKEGQELARKKQLANAIGNSQKTEKSGMTAAEYALKYNLPRFN